MKIKIKELPDIVYDNIEDSDLLLVETSSDTYKMTVADAKSLFSADAKINALEEELTNLINLVSESTTEKITKLTEQVTEISQNISNNNGNLSKALARIMELETGLKEANTKIDKNIEDISNLDKRITANEELLKTHTEEISAISNRVSALENNVSDLQQTTIIHSKNIENIKTKLNELQDQIDKMGINTSEDLSKEVEALTKLVDEKYNELETQIDFWHHDPEGNNYIKI